MFEMICLCLSDSQVGVLRVWNVSRPTPLDSFKLKKTGFHALHVLNSPLAKKGNIKKKNVLENPFITTVRWLVSKSCEKICASQGQLCVATKAQHMRLKICQFVLIVCCLGTKQPFKR